MRYEVTLRGPRGDKEAVIVEADTGDEAVEKAFQPYKIITSVQPVQADARKRAKAAD